MNVTDRSSMRAVVSHALRLVEVKITLRISNDDSQVVMARMARASLRIY
jgi:hypothetical protein